MNFESILLILSALLAISKLANSQCSYGYVFPESGSQCIECGKPYRQPNIRIAGGMDSVSYSWPATVYIRQNFKGYITSSNNTQITVSASVLCSGTIIDDYTIVSSTSCSKTTFYFSSNVTFSNVSLFYPTLESMIDIYAGVDNITMLNSKSNSSNVVKLSIAKVISHENSSAYENNIAIFILSKPIQFNEYIQPACLPNPSYGTVYPTTTMDAYVAGWGFLSLTNFNAPYILQNVAISILSSTDCSILQNSTTQICAGTLAGGKGLCLLDFGDGLYIYDSSISKYVLVGLASYFNFNGGCALPGNPGVYTRISYYRDWIVANSNYITGACNSNKSVCICQTGYTGRTCDIAIGALVAGILVPVIVIIVIVVVIYCFKRKKSLSYGNSNEDENMNANLPKNEYTPIQLRDLSGKSNRSVIMVSPRY